MDTVVVAQTVPEDMAQDEAVMAAIRTLVAKWTANEHPHRLRLFGLEEASDGWRLLTAPEPPFMLRAFLDASEVVSPADRMGWALAITLDVADAIATLDEMHGQIDHRSVGFERDGRVTLLPARVRALENRAVTGRSRPPGGLAWLTPEECAGRARTPTSDVHQLAYLARRLIGAPSPYASLTDIEILHAKLQRGPILGMRAAGLDVPPTLDDAIARGLAFDPSARFASVSLLADALRPFARGSVAISERIAAAAHAAGPAGARERGIPLLEGYVLRPCSKRWDELTATDRADVRDCAECKLSVQRVRTLGTLLPLAGSCVFYDPA